MNNKVVLITGGSQGIGKGIAEVFAAEGANVVIISRTKEKLEDVAREVKEHGGKISYFVADIT
ncbi:MAG: SDR family NAD(P)-dependent oxidoreductase, partial [Alphaproteobacteria bacterium]